MKTETKTHADKCCKGCDVDLCVCGCGSEVISTVIQETNKPREATIQEMTPLYLHDNGCGVVYLRDQFGRDIATFGRLEDGIDNYSRIGEAEKLQAFIVRAVNEYDNLLEAAKTYQAINKALRASHEALLEALNAYVTMHDKKRFQMPEDNENEGKVWSRIRKMAQEAIAQAEGK